MNKTLLTLFATFMMLDLETYAQSDSSAHKSWGVETELFQPALPTVGIFHIQATRTITSLQRGMRGDLLIGAYIRPNVKHNIVEKINEYLLAIGYRQYLWKGLHIEAISDLGYAWGTKNRMDGKDYNNLSWFWEANTGYRFIWLKKNPYHLYVIPQVGILSSIIADIGPRNGKPDTFLQGNLLVGINF